MPEGITVDLIPDPAGIDSLTRQIRQTGRAYPLFDIAHLILKRPDRYHLQFRATGNQADGTPRQFYVCNLDDTVWLSEGDAVRHILSRHFGTFYSTEKIAVEPPKGTYTFVAQCGMSGIVLGPPNLHGYQNKLQKLHADRFSRMPFDVYKSRVKIVRDEAVVKQWIEEQSFKFEYTALNLPEPVKLPSREAVEQHFRQTHLANIVQPNTVHTVKTAPGRESLTPILRRLARREFDHQQRFPLKMVTRLSDDFAHRGLHFFKVNKTVLHVAVARPRYLDVDTSPVGDGIKRIVTTIQATPACTRRKLLEALGISLDAPAAPAPTAPAPAPAEAAAPAAEGAPAETPTPAPAPAAPTEPAPSPELQAIVTDLHWLIHEGHVIEFANGHLEVAKKPAPKPPPAPRPPKNPPAAKPGTGSATSPEAAVAPAAEAPVETAEVESAAVVEPVPAPAAEAAPESAPQAEAQPEATATDAPAPAAEDEGKINPS